MARRRTMSMVPAVTGGPGSDVINVIGGAAKPARKKGKRRGRPKKPGRIKKGWLKATKAAHDEKHTLAAVGAGAVLGLLKAKNITLPHLTAIGEAGTYGLALWFLGRYTNNEIFKHAATGLLTVAGFQLGQKMLSGYEYEPGVPSMEPDMAGSL